MSVLRRKEAIKKSGYKVEAHRKSWLVEQRSKVVFLRWKRDHLDNGDIVILDLKDQKIKTNYGYKETLEATKRIIDGDAKKTQVLLQIPKSGTGPDHGVTSGVKCVVPILFDVELFKKGNKILGNVVRVKAI